MNPSSTNEERPGNALRIERERDLYRRLLDLGQQTRIEPFLKEALVLVAELAGAREIYLQLDDPRSEEAAWWLAHGFSDAEIEDVRRHLSSGIIAEALATGHSIDTPSALLDPRFAERGSVERVGIGAVLCVPIGTDPPLGVLYLQDRNLPGGFSSADKSEAELFARHLAPQVRRLVEAQHSASEGDPTLPMRQKLRCDGVVGRSPALAGLLKEVALVAPLDVSVLLTGESGTGKSQIARVLHDNSPRAGKPFVELNCAALPDTLIESELFGALPGAHSTATRRQLGKIAAAEGGTLFLDEVGELAAPAQSKLLQVLQSREYHPLGATRPERADIRVVAATNADLKMGEKC
jgi:Nif-specific regulatory protein